MASSSSSARESVSGVPAWVLLDRAPRLTDLGGMASEADVLLELVPPPAISTAFLDRALLPDDAAWDTAPCRVEGADASGHLLLAFPSPRAPGESNLLVCRPVPSSSGGAAKAKGRARFLPAFPEDTLGHAISTAAPTGIIADQGANTGGDGYYVVQLQMSPSSRPSIATALCFSSDDNAWTVREVAGDHRWHGFRARCVVSHDRRDHGDARLVFVDLRRGLLLFHPRLTDSLFVDLPHAPEGGGGGEVHEGDATVESSQGRIVYLLFYEVPEGTMVGLWWLSEDEEERRWQSHFHLPSDELFACDERVSPLQPVRGIGPVDPNCLTRLFFTLGSPAGDSASSLCVEVRPAGMIFKRARLLEIQPCTSLESALVCPLCDDPRKTRTWTQTLNKALDDGKELGLIARSLVHKSRKHMHKLPGALELVGSTLNLPLTGTLVTAAKALNTVNTSIRIGEAASSWLWERRPAAPGGSYRVVGTRQEAQDVINEWLRLNKPNLMVDPAVGVTQQQWEELLAFFAQSGAETLVQHYDYVLVERPPR